MRNHAASPFGLGTPPNLGGEFADSQFRNSSDTLKRRLELQFSAARYIDFFVGRLRCESICFSF